MSTRPGKLSLARFEAGASHSRGRWLVKQLPAVALLRHKSGKWKIYAGPGIITPDQTSQQKTWGHNWAAKHDRNTMRLSGNKYQTINQALHALEQITITERPSSALNQLIS